MHSLIWPCVHGTIKIHKRSNPFMQLCLTCFSFSLIRNKISTDYQLDYPRARLIHQTVHSECVSPGGQWLQRFSCATRVIRYILAVRPSFPVPFPSQASPPERSSLKKCRPVFFFDFFFVFFFFDACDYMKLFSSVAKSNVTGAS